MRSSSDSSRSIGRLRILEIGHSYLVRLNRCVPAALAARDGAEVTVAAPSFFYGDLRPLTLEPDATPAGYDLAPLGTRLSRRIHIFWYERRKLKELVRSRNWDIVSAWEEPYIYAGYQIAQAVKPTRSRFCFRTAQSLVKNYPPPFRQFESSVLKRAQGWIAGGELVKRALVSKGESPERGRVIPLGVNTHQFLPLTEAQKEDARRELGLKGPLLGFVGRLVPQKGIKVMLEALEKVSGNWSLLVLGSGPLESSITQWAEARGWGQRVRVLLARHSEVPRWVGAMDLLLAPSQTTPRWAEQFGRMVVEAFACKVPVLSSDSGELPFVIGEAGRTLPEADVEQWAAAINHLLSSEAERRELGERGYERCLRHYAAEAVAKTRLAYYRELMDKPVVQA